MGKRIQKNSQVGKPPYWSLPSILAYLLLVSIIFSGFSLSKYTMACADTSSGRVAAFAYEIEEPPDYDPSNPEQADIYLYSTNTVFEDPVLIRNTGEVTISVTPVITGDATASFDVTGPIILAPGESTSIMLTIWPSNQLDKQTLNITYDVEQVD